MPNLGLRLDAEAHQALLAYAEDKGINLSAAVRILLAIALERVATIDQAAHAQAVREGLSVGRAMFSKSLHSAVAVFSAVE